MGVNRRKVLKQTGVGAAVLIGGSAVAQGTAIAATRGDGATTRAGVAAGQAGVVAATPMGSNAVSDVSFVGAPASGTRQEMIMDVLEPWRSTVAAGMAGKTVLIKANLVGLAAGRGGTDPGLPVTHVDALRGLIEYLRSIDPAVPIIIGDCGAVANISSTWSKAGYPAVTTEYSDVTLMDLGDPANMPTVDQTIWKPDLSATTTIPISSAFTDPKYYVISICRPKTHDTVVMTATSKNILLAAPLRSATVNGAQVNPKGLMHGRGSGSTGKKRDEAKCLSYNIFQLANVIYPSHAPALCVLDAWEGMQGDGPVSGSSVMQHCAVAGTDSLAVDRLAAVLMGFSDTATDPVDVTNPSYTDMRYLTWISNAGFGNYDLEKINFILGSLDELRSRATTYDLHSGYANEVDWSGGPPRVLPEVAGRDAQHLDPRPFLLPQPPHAVGAGDVGVTFSLPVETGVRLGIFTAQGVEVRRLAHDFLAAGRYSLSWDGRDSHGSRVAAGDYVVRLGFDSRSLDDQERSVEDRVRLAG